MFIRNTPELIENGVIKTFACGSPPLHDFIEKNNIHYIYLYIQEKNKKTIWVYVLSNELSELLIEWKNNNPNMKGGE
jgi:hypothetical protein